MTGEDRYARAAPGDGPPPGVRELDHTADVGIEIEAPTLASLLRRAAEGVWYLVFGERVEVGEPTPGDAEEEARSLRLQADAPDALLLKWLQELLYWFEVDRFVARRVRFDELSERRLEACAWGEPAARDAVRDLKGVTYHGLAAERAADAWKARVIFDI